ncbi:MAG TPA: glycosyltransferase family 2 protein [Dongiaceae bacterium]|jgi:glycosyltransferase involved in cell wall biosynthesis
MFRRRIQRWANKCLRPAIWRSEQYPPRALAFPDHRAENPPWDAPSIAIVTPVLNQAAFIRAAIDSVLRQSYPRLAYIVRDGGSSDGTVEILRSYGDSLEWVSAGDRGQADAINQGLARVGGDIMGWLNGDDMLAPGTLAYVARFFQANPDVDIVYGHRIYIDIHGRETGRCVLPVHDPGTLKFADYIPQETLFWRRRVWQALCPIDISFHCAMDWDFILRAQAAGFSFRRLPRFLGCFRVHPAQKTISGRATSLAEMELLRRRTFGRDIATDDVNRGIEMYLLRHVVLDRLYRFGALRY